MSYKLNEFFGISTIYSPGAGGFQRSVSLFDLRRLARNLSKIGVSRYMINLNCEGGYLLAPSAVYGGVLGVGREEKISSRDIVRLLGTELCKYGIDLFLYYSTDPAYFDSDAAKACGVSDGSVTDELIRKHAEIIGECSRSFGGLVRGWWIDGCTNELTDLLCAACKSGNRDALVSFSRGVKNVMVKSCLCEDYTAGDFCDFTFVPKSGSINGAQAHIISTLGKSEDGSWGQIGLGCDAGYLYGYIKKLKAVGCALTIDCKIYPDGTFDASQFNELCKLSDMLKNDGN